ncbi:DUF1450 domain-containing protein [Haloplasma contractile]|uniref:DUF1450 domain-containing protein n=1 Tax=Haloplasma contractile SSD-17B TaxID=1033810 RepID=U2E9L5_9MOLU|nr:DUF1450 domain-containing protein [Haloplasma contractile]ERJ11833.1 hypothetical protein HLPCO_002072 [Haloplasma contractile SSD-17B]
MIRVCPHCSGVDTEGLKKKLPNETIKSTCVGVCKSYKDKVYAAVDQEIIYADSNMEIQQKIVERLKNKDNE